MNRPKFLFGDIVVVDAYNIGVIVKTWQKSNGEYFYEVYVREYNQIMKYNELAIDRYRVRHKYLSKEELEWQRG